MNYSKHINEMAPDLLRRAASKQRRRLKDDSYLKTITAYDYLKKLRRVEDFMDYADEIIDRINAGKTGTPAGDEEARRIISQTAATPAPQAKTLAAAPSGNGYPAPVTLKDHKVSLKNVPLEKKYNRTPDPVINRSNDWDVRQKTLYIVVFISNVDGATCAVEMDAMSKADAAVQSLQKMWDVQEILDVIRAAEYHYETAPSAAGNSGASVPAASAESESLSGPVIDKNDYDTPKELADACAGAITGGEFSNIRELVADVKIDQATEDSITSRLYEGEDNEGNRWGGRKSSVRSICESESYDWQNGQQDADPESKDYQVKFVTSLGTDGNDDFADGYVTPRMMRRALREGIIHIVFIKANGDERQAFATTNEQILEMNDALSTTDPQAKTATRPDHIRFYDMTIRAWRSFLMERLTMVYDETF